MWKNLICWWLERVVELLLAAYLLLVLLGSNENTRWPGFWGDILVNSIYLTAFYIGSGYIFTTLFMGVIKPLKEKIIHSLASVVVFLLHAAFFVFFIGKIENSKALPLLVFGACIVAMSTVFGGSVRLLLKK